MEYIRDVKDCEKENDMIKKETNKKKKYKRKRKTKKTLRMKATQTDSLDLIDDKSVVNVDVEGKGGWQDPVEGPQHELEEAWTPAPPTGWRAPSAMVVLTTMGMSIQTI